MIMDLIKQSEPDSLPKSLAGKEVSDGKEKKAEIPEDKKVYVPNLCKRFVKRSFDIVFGGCLLLVLSPFFLLFTPVVAIAMKGNPFFVQPRPGKNGKIFKMLKYRTMTNAKDKDGNLLPDEKRLTRFGKLMRKLSVDELPEAWNIFIGQMSVVGPRPLLVRDMTFFDEVTMQRQIVSPGLTGLAQVRGRNDISWEDKFRYDLEYIRKQGFFYDLRILFETVFKVFRSEGINTQGMATSEDYGDYLLRTGKVTQEEYREKQELAKELLKSA